MSTPYLGEIKTYSFGFPPKGWAACNGQFLPINQNQALFSLLGTTYGGNGQTTFALPNLQGVAAMGFSGSYPEGATGGEATHTLLTNEMPAHVHPVAASSAATPLATAIAADYPAAPTVAPLYAGAANTTLGAGSTSVGGSTPHENRQPYLVLNFCIALTGIFPSRN